MSITIRAAWINGLCAVGGAVAAAIVYAVAQSMAAPSQTSGSAYIVEDDRWVIAGLSITVDVGTFDVVDVDGARWHSTYWWQEYGDRWQGNRSFTRFKDLLADIPSELDKHLSGPTRERIWEGLSAFDRNYLDVVPMDRQLSLVVLHIRGHCDSCEVVAGGKEGEWSRIFKLNTSWPLPVPEAGGESLACLSEGETLLVTRDDTRWEITIDRVWNPMKKRAPLDGRDVVRVVWRRVPRP